MGRLEMHLAAATGFLELGMIDDAAAELENIEPEERDKPEVISFRVHLYLLAENWTAMEVAARRMVKFYPEMPVWWIQWAAATRQSVSIDAAISILLDAESKHPNEGTIKFNLGCYFCQIGDLAEAKRRVAAAIALNEKYRLLALDDPDLQPLWDDLAVMLKESPDKLEG